MRKTVLLLAGAFLLSSAVGLLHAQQAPASSPSQPAVSQSGAAAPSPSQASTARPTSTAQSWTGKVSKKDNDFMLEDSATKASYKLDDAAKARSFDGKDVKVTGTLDSATNTIHVTSIDESKSAS